MSVAEKGATPMNGGNEANVNENGGVKAGKKLKAKAYGQELAKLHVELVKLQEWVKFKGLKVCIVLEGRDGAGKGGVIKAITEVF
jgi:polyphosphate kinase 2 (PPK2 family)